MKEQSGDGGGRTSLECTKLKGGGSGGRGGGKGGDVLVDDQQSALMPLVVVTEEDLQKGGVLEEKPLPGGRQRARPLDHGGKEGGGDALRHIGG